MLHVRVEKELLVRAGEVLAAVGLSAEDAVRMLLHQIAADPALSRKLEAWNTAPASDSDRRTVCTLPSRLSWRIGPKTAAECKPPPVRQA